MVLLIHGPSWQWGTTNRRAARPASLLRERGRTEMLTYVSVRDSVTGVVGEFGSVSGEPPRVQVSRTSAQLQTRHGPRECRERRRRNPGSGPTDQPAEQHRYALTLVCF